VIEDLEGIDPMRLFDELHVRSARYKAGHQGKRDQQTGQGANQGQPAYGARLFVTPQCEQQKSERDGRPDSKTQQTHFYSSPTC